MNKKISLNSVKKTDSDLKKIALQNVFANQFEELQKLLTDNLDKAGDILSAAPEEGPNKGINVAWVLACEKQFGLLGKLIDQKLIASDILAASPEEGPSKGINVACLLVAHKQFGLLGELIDQKLVTSETLAASPEDGVLKGINVVWLLAYFEQFGLLKALIDQGLVTSEKLAASPEGGVLKGINVVCLLVAHKQFDLLLKLKTKITLDILMGSAPQRLNTKISQFLSYVSREITRNNSPSTTTSEAGPATVKRSNSSPSQDQTGEPPRKRGRPSQNNSVVDAAQALMGLSRSQK